MTDHRSRVDELLADYRRSKEHLAEVHRHLAAVRGSASSADGSVTVTVGPRGTLTNLTLSEDAYRIRRPQELAVEIVRLIAKATVSALSEASEILAPALPPGSDPQAVLIGTADLGAEDIAPADVAAVSGGAAEPDDDDFEAESWLSDPWSRSR